MFQYITGALLSADVFGHFMRIFVFWESGACGIAECARQAFYVYK